MLAVVLWLFCSTKEISAVDGIDDGLLVSDPPQSLECWDIQCVGEGCIYETIGTNWESTAPTCSASLYCYVKETALSPDIVQYTAGCDGPCVLTTTQPTTIDLSWPKRRRRESRNTLPNCCETDYCNHNSPCGSLNCTQNLVDGLSTTTMTTAVDSHAMRYFPYCFVMFTQGFMFVLHVA